jgi:hypothetical protein
MRADAKAFRLASDSLAPVADLLDQQVELLEGAIGIVRDPVSAVRSAGKTAWPPTSHRSTCSKSRGGVVGVPRQLLWPLA